MCKPKTPRKINKNLFWSKIKLRGLTLKDMGTKLNPPVSKVRVCQIIAKAAPENRLKEIASLLGSNVNTLFPKFIEEKPVETTTRP